MLFRSYNFIFSLLYHFKLVIEHKKSEVFYFSRSYGNFEPFPLDLSTIKGPILQLKDTWRYFGFIFDRKLSFYKHICFYSNKALLTVKSMKMLENLSWGLLPHHKQLLFRTYILSITLYGFFL